MLFLLRILEVLWKWSSTEVKGKMANCLPAQPLQTTCCPTENASRLFSKG